MPMLKLITSRSGNADAQANLARALRAKASGPHPIVMTHRSGQPKGDAWYFSAENVWMCLDREDGRFWNPCGVGCPESQPPHNIVIEVNPPFEGVNGQVQGAFAADDDGRVFLVHRGRVGGNAIGARREALWAHAGFTPVQMSGGTSSVPVVLVGQVSGECLGRDLGNFVRGVAEFKAHLRAMRQSGKP